MPTPNRQVTPQNLKKLFSILPQVATGTVACAAMYMYVYWDPEVKQYTDAKKDAQTKKT